MMLLERQKEYKTAALRAKKQGDLEQARFYLKTGKVRVQTPVSDQHRVFCISSAKF